jgi:hypothetical protein
LLTLPAGPRCREFVRLNLLLGAASTVLALVSVDLWIKAADALVAGQPYEVWWSKHVVLPNIGPHLTVAFALSQLAAALVLLPLLPSTVRWLERLKSHKAAGQAPNAQDIALAVRGELVEVTRQQRSALGQMGELALTGMRLAGREAEHQLSAAHSKLESLLSGKVLDLPRTAEGSRLASACFACLQTHRSLEVVLRQAESLTDSRIMASAQAIEAIPLPDCDQAVLNEIQALLADGFEALITSLESAIPVNLEGARTREILTNGIEARVRRGLLASDPEPEKMRGRLRVLELIDAYETAGNQLYRLAEILGESRSHEPLISIAPSRLEGPVPNQVTN